MAETVPKITIKELRARHNLTQAQFAESIGTTAQTVSCLGEKCTFYFS